jgi:putative DNA methylase
MNLWRCAKFELTTKVVKMKSDLTAPTRQARLIETDAFPFEFLSTIAERESWRKELYRPIYHIHKWWAKRLGSIFRGILLGCLMPESTNLEEVFYQKHDFSGISVFDPFMGSGTTIGEAHKLGFTALGRDINPVACESVRVALGPLDRLQLQNAFAQLSSMVGERIRELYQSTDENGQRCDVLYYFWVKVVPCPHCKTNVDLFSTRIIARNAYPERKPEVQICCPQCGDIFPALNSSPLAHCRSCGLDFNPHAGPAEGAKVTCPACSQPFLIVEAVRTSGHPPAHRLYGKLLLTAEGKKRYLPATPKDIQAYQACSGLLRSELEHGVIRLPEAVLSDGFNTRQAINYNYRAWRDFFNDRQLLALGWLQEAISRLSDTSTRDALFTLFSGVLEFNNLFASYKGEGTGAVRHMFSHHILKPERAPIEANVWGTPKSSGSFSNLFETRLLRALDYRTAPFEVTAKGSGKAHHTSIPFSGRIDTTWPPQGNLQPRAIYLSCGSSDETRLPDKCLDLIVTDPPFFDNVHYSELADFFYAWQSLYQRGFINGARTTRNVREVQDADADSFAAKLRAVLAECYRILKDDGLLVFTYHHSRAEGWTSVMEAALGAGLSIVEAHPVKAEMSVATPKSQAKEPIQLDIILVCKKREQDTRGSIEPSEALDEAARRAIQKVKRLMSAGLTLSLNDRRIVLVSQFISALGPVTSAGDAVRALLKRQVKLEQLARDLPDETDGRKVAQATGEAQQMELIKITAHEQIMVNPFRSGEENESLARTL